MEYIIYRARFQPITKEIVEAIDSIFDENPIKKDFRLILGIVTDQLFETKDLDEIIKRRDDYFIRFKRNYNPITEGTILKLINEAISHLTLERRKRIMVTFMPDFLCSLLILRPDYNPNPLRLSDSSVNRIKRYLSVPRENRTWYFPIFDIDDVKDVGYAYSAREKILIKDFHKKSIYRIRYVNLGGYGYSSYLLLSKNQDALRSHLPFQIIPYFNINDMIANQELNIEQCIQEEVFLSASGGFRVPELDVVISPEEAIRRLNENKAQLSEAFKKKYGDITEINSDYVTILSEYRVLNERIEKIIKDIDDPRTNYYDDHVEYQRLMQQISGLKKGKLGYE
ncbi:MAG: hypothetical protein Q8N56_00675 [bacterium]|nr:hypothetical protein [bacterium]